MPQKDLAHVGHMRYPGLEQIPATSWENPNYTTLRNKRGEEKTSKQTSKPTTTKTPHKKPAFKLSHNYLK